LSAQIEIEKQRAFAESEQIKLRAAAQTAQAEAEARRSAELEKQLVLQREISKIVPSPPPSEIFRRGVAETMGCPVDRPPTFSRDAANPAFKTTT